MTEKFLQKAGILRLIVLSLLLVLVGCLVSFLTSKWVMSEKGWKHDEPHGHMWLHDELGLSAEEAAKIDAFEAEYRSERGILLEEFEKRIDGLSELLRTTDSCSPQVNQAVHHLHEVHGQIQSLSIEHYYDMLSVLPPEKQDRLRALAIEALSEPE
jgi:hypothetical protein